MEDKVIEPAEAVETLRAGGKVRMTVGTQPDDPVLVLWNEDGAVMSESVAGWSAGVEEPVCGIESNFLLTYFEGREKIEAVMT